MCDIEFDYDAYERFCDGNNKQAREFIGGRFLPVSSWTLGRGTFGINSRDKEPMLAEQLEAIARVMEAPNDWIPYLEPWHGVGVFAEAFGCPFEWNDTDAPWTRTIVDNIEDLRRLKLPRVKEAKLLQHVLRTTEYFEEQTNGRVHIAATDTQSPVDTLSLICDPTWMLTEIADYPEDFHRVLSGITDLIIELTLEQRKLCSKPVMPGHTIWSPGIFGGISLSEDMLVMLSPDYYNEFAKPYNERIADALGGVTIHSCGRWGRLFDSVKQTRGLTMVDLAISKAYDPGPNEPEDIIAGFEGTGIPVQVRADYSDIEKLDVLLSSGVRLNLVMWWNDDPKARERMYFDIKERWGKYHQ